MPRNIQEWLSWLIKLRIVVVTTLLGVSLGVESAVPRTETLTELFWIIGGTYVLTIGHYCWLRWSSKHVLQAYFQTACDLLMTSAIIYVTGGLDSYFSFFFLLSIIMSSILLYRWGAFLTATASSILLLAQYFVVRWEILPTTNFYPLDPRTAKYVLGSNIFAFFAVAFLSSHLSESLRKTGSELEDNRDKLASLQAFNENIINSMRGGLFTTDLDGIVTLFNRSASDITGLKTEQAIGSDVHELFGFGEGEGPPLPLDRKLLRFEKSLKPTSGEEIYLGFTVSPLMVEQGRHVGYVYTFQDLTEIKRLERQVLQRDRMAAVGRMAAAIAHEIRNPLTAISGSFHVLNSELDLNEEQRKLAENISTETKRLYKTITDFLTYAKPVQCSRRAVDLKKIADDTVALLKNSPEVSGNHHIECVYDRDRPFNCRVDPNLIKQVFWNLSTNALKAMPGGGTLSIQLKQLPQGQVQISFCDTGIGLGSEEQEKIFEPFQSKFSTGTGLGLSIVSQIVEAHGGTIGVKSAKGIGTCFQMEFPAGRSAEGLDHDGGLESQGSQEDVQATDRR
jgi:two-component system sensor histidine kinase PilS (NtrC family)